MWPRRFWRSPGSSFRSVLTQLERGYAHVRAQFLPMLMLKITRMLNEHCSCFRSLSYPHSCSKLILSMPDLLNFLKLMTLILVMLTIRPLNQILVETVENFILPFIFIMSWVESEPEPPPPPPAAKCGSGYTTPAAGNSDG